MPLEYYKGNTFLYLFCAHQNASISWFYGFTGNAEVFLSLSAGCLSMKSLSAELSPLVFHISVSPGEEAFKSLQSPSGTLK